DNNLSEEMVWSLQEMQAASRDPSVGERIAVEALYDPQDEAPRKYDFPLSSYATGASEDFSLSTVAPLQPRAEDPVVLLERLVGRLGKRAFLVLSGHGSGSVGDFLSDEKPAKALSIPRLGKILQRTPLEILGLDSCQMSTVEVGYEVRESVSYLVASEGPVANTGWPYRQVLEALAERAADSSAEMARAVAESYLRFYRDYEIAGMSTDIAVSDLSRMEGVAEAVSQMAKALEAPLQQLAPDGLEEAIELSELGAEEPDERRSARDAIVLAHWSAQSYKCDRYTDLHDFARQLLRFAAGRSGPRIDRIRSACRQVLDAVEGAVLRAGTTGPELQHSHGLSIYFPWSVHDFIPEYRNLRFAEDTGWRKFLETYLGATRRMRRFQSENFLSPNVPAEPRRTSEGAFSETRDVEAGTRKDVEAGTRKGLLALLDKSCRSTMKNPPEGFYPPPGRK
ncbi:MAG TPA: clostripain-related cysteine peptidase, partial [Vicinamibacteria bacterium]